MSPIATQHDIPLITIDGPSGSGKGTLSLLIARALGWHFLDSGALYRALAVAAKHQGLSITEEAALVDLALALPVAFHEFQILLEGEDVTREIRQETTGNQASQLSVFPAVRQALLAKQRAFLQKPGLVADGRDMGTVVFPEAQLKLFLEATPQERAKRRFEQLKDAQTSVTLAELEHELAQRDARDRKRAIAPLRAADDAVVIDTTGLDSAAVFAHAMQLVEQKWPQLLPKS